MRSSFAFVGVSLSVLFGVLAACSDDETTATPLDPPGGSFDAGSTSPTDSGNVPANDASNPLDAGADTGKVLPAGFLEPIPYLSRADNPFLGVSFPVYSHFEDWETNATVAPGVTPSGPGFYIVNGSLVDSVDNDDGLIDGNCKKDGGASCHSVFGGGTIEFAFDATVLGGLPTHVGIVWTDGSQGADAIFEAYDPANVIIGSKTATAVGNADVTGSTDEDRFFGVVAPGGVLRIVVKSSGGGVEVDHLTYGR